MHGRTHVRRVRMSGRTHVRPLVIPLRITRSPPPPPSFLSVPFVFLFKVRKQRNQIPTFNPILSRAMFTLGHPWPSHIGHPALVWVGSGFVPSPPADAGRGFAACPFGARRCAGRVRLGPRLSRALVGR